MVVAVVIVLAFAACTSGSYVEGAVPLPLGVENLDEDKPRNISSYEDFNEESATDPAVEVKVVFVLFRHGINSASYRDFETLMPFTDLRLFVEDNRRLTDMGANECLFLGKYLRRRYKKILSEKYDSSEIEARSMNSTLMTLSMEYVLKGLYPQEKDVPYDVVPYLEDDFQFARACPRYKQYRNYTRYHPDKPLADLLKELEQYYDTVSTSTGVPYTDPKQIYYLVQLVEIMSAVYFTSVPQWLGFVMDDLKSLATINILVDFYTTRQIKLGVGVIMNEIMDAIDLVERNETTLKMYLAAGQDLNMLAWMAAVRVLVPHIPDYSSSFALEICYMPQYKDYGIKAAYKPTLDEATKIMDIRGCTEDGFCSTRKFKEQFKKYAMTFEEYQEECFKEDKSLLNDGTTDSSSATTTTTTTTTTTSIP